MMHSIFPHGYTEQERRLLRFGVFDAIGDVATGAWEGMQKIGQAGIDAASGTARALNYYMNKNELTVEQERQLGVTGEFLRTAPREIIMELEKGYEKNEYLTFDEIANLTDHNKWLAAFKEDFTKDDPVALTLKNGPKGVIQSLPVDTRTLLFEKYVQTVIPEEARTKNPVTEGIFKDITAKKKDIIQAMEAIFGATNGLTDVQRIIAQDAVRHMYFRDGIRWKGDQLFEQPTFDLNGVAVYDMTGGGTDLLRRDFQSAYEANPAATSLQELADTLKPCLLKGAINLGVLRPDDFAVLRQEYSQKEREKAASLLENRGKLKDLSGAVERQARRESKDMVEIFQDMNPAEKLALIVGAFMFLRTRIGKAAGATFGVMYFSQKFLLKQDSPIQDVWSPLLQGLADKTKGIMPSGAKKFMDEYNPEDMTPEFLDRRAAMMQQFLTTEVREDVESSVNAFIIMADVPLSELARHLKLGIGANDAVLSLNDPAFRKLLVTQQMRRGLTRTQADRLINTVFGGDSPYRINIADPKIEQALQATSVARSQWEVGNALRVVFYRIAAKDPKNADAVRMIESERLNHPGGLYDFRNTYEKNGRTIDLQQVFETLVLEGMKNAPSVTLGQFVQDSVEIRVSDTEREGRERNRLAENIKKEIESYEYNGASAGMKVKEENDVYTVGLDDGSGEPIHCPVTFKLDEFAAANTREILSRWIQDAIVQMEKKIKALPPGAHGTLSMRQQNDDIQLSIDPDFRVLDDIAQVPAYEFFKKEPNEIQDKFTEWKTKINAAKVATPPTVNSIDKNIFR